MKRRNRSRLYTVLSSPFMFLAVLVAFYFMARAAWGIYEKADEGSMRLEAAQAQLAKLEADKASLAERVDLLSTPAGVRAELRSKYHAVEPGESVAVIIDPTSSPDSASSVLASSTAAKASGWQKFLRMIGF